MKIEKIVIRNFMAIQDAELYPNDICALVGRNNSGKSTLLKALQILFSGSSKGIDEESYHMLDTTKKIEIISHFGQLSGWEKEHFGSIASENSLVIARSISLDENDNHVVNNYYIKSVPVYEWLVLDNVSASNIKEWLKKIDELAVGGHKFSSYLANEKPTVQNWKDAINSFMSDNVEHVDCEQKMMPNPKGYPGVLKAGLPEFIYIPAVRDISDEAKFTKNNPFGQLIAAMIRRMSESQKQILNEKIKEINTLLNRGSGERFKAIQSVEDGLNKVMNELIACDIELEMPAPKVQEVLQGAKIYANDGIRTSIERKGHGMQRAMIFAILRSYAEVMNFSDDESDEDKSKSIIFAFEEPELYMHPQMQRTMMSVFREIASGRDQVFYSTHSSLFLDISRFDDICIFRNQKSCCRVNQLKMSDMLDDLKNRHGKVGTPEGIRSLYYNAFTTSANEGFFADKVIIVEGYSEEYSFPIFAEMLGRNFDKSNYAVIQSGGKGCIDRLFRVYSSLGIPVYVVFDVDRETKDKENIQTTNDLFKLLEWKCEDLSKFETISNENFTAFSNNIEYELISGVSNYTFWLQEASSLYGKVGKPLKIRYIAMKLRETLNQGGRLEEVVPKVFRDMIENIYVKMDAKSILVLTS